MLQLPLPFFKNRAEKGEAYEKFLLDTNCSVAQRYHHHHNFKKEKIIMKKAIYRFTSPARNFCTKAGQYLRNQRGDFYISDGVKIIIAVVLGALLLAALTTIFNDTVIPRITQEIEGLFS